jgi:hypothetical protein
MSAFAEVPVTAATLSTTYSSRYPASNAIDGRLETIVASRGQQGGWLSVEAHTRSTIEYVAVYNRIDLTGVWPAQLGTFEVWVGSSEGDTSPSTAQLCGTMSARTNLNHRDHEPYVVRCNPWWHASANGAFVTIKQTGPPRYLVVAEVKVYEAASTSPVGTPTVMGSGR